MIIDHVYLDHNATSALHPIALEAMLPWIHAQSGNPTSRHQFGRAARDAIEHAREQVASACDTYPSQVILTASGTEANNFAIKGMPLASSHMQILTSAIEHPCVTRPALAMQTLGYRAEQIAVNATGEIELAALKQQLLIPTGLVSVMLANNETGVIQDIAAIAALAHTAGALMHTDAVQALGKIPVSFSALNVDAMSISSHKIGGPQGAAALVLDKRIDIMPLLHGGGQEKGLRSGTENVAAIVGFGMACEIAANNLTAYNSHTNALRKQLEIGLSALHIPIFSQHAARLPNTSFFAVNGIEGETLVMALDRNNFAVASGSACSSDSTEPSHVLRAMAVAEDLARSAIRVSFGMHNTAAQLDAFLATLKNEILRLKRLTSIAA